MRLDAQQTQYGWRNYTTNDGLPSSEVYTVIQDKKGFLWFGTDKGVSRFDGYSFQNFGAKEGLLDNVINCIQEDETGRVWFSSMWGKLYYFEKDSIRSFKHNHLIEAYQKSFFLSAGFARFEKSENSEGYVLLGLVNLGILKITDSGQTELIVAQQAPALLVFKSGKKNIVVFQIKINSTVKPETHLQLPIFNYEGQKLVEQGLIQILTSTDYITNARLKTIGTTTFLFTRHSIHRKEKNNQFSDTPCDNAIYDVLTDEDGQIWTAEGRNGGVKVFANAGVLGKTEPQTLLKDVSAVTFLRDRDGGYWVTTIEKGVFYLCDKKVRIFNSDNTQLPFDVVTAVADFDASKVFVGFWQGEVGLFDKSTSVYQKIDRLVGDNLFDMKWDKAQGKLLFGGTTSLRAWQKGKLTTIKPENSNERSRVGAKKINFRYRQDAAWIVTNGGLEEATGYIIHPHYKSSAVNVSGRIFSIFEDSKKRLWVAKQNGLYRLDNDSLAPAPFIHAALQTRIEDIIELPDGRLIFATKGNGLVIWDEKRASHITKENGLLTDMIDNLAADAKGNIWVGTVAGLHKLSEQSDGQWAVQPITMFQGLPTNEIKDIAPNAAGVFLATRKGLVFYNDRLSNTSTAIPFLEKIVAGKKQLPDLLPSFLFEHDENDVELNWNLINFRMFGKISYRYRLDTLAQWRHTINRTVALAALSSGAYRFEVQAQNEMGNWSSSLIIPFIVRPVWYATAWFRFILLTATALGVYLYNRSRINALKTENVLQLHINDLERSALATQMNPHFIFNCLNSIQLLIHHGDKDEAMTYLSRFAKMVRFTLESTRRGKVSIDEEVETLNNYLSLEKLRFKEDLEFTIHVDASVDSFNTEIPAMLIQPFVENALKHGFESMDKTAKIDVLFEAEADFLKVEIRDNGKGIDKNFKINALSDTFTDKKTFSKLEMSQSSLLKNREEGARREKTVVGIALSQKRLALHNGRNIPEDFRIEPIQCVHGNVLGTVVRLKIRIEKA